MLLSAWDRDERIDLRERMRLLFKRLSQTDSVEGMRVTYLTRTRPSARWCSLGRCPRSWRAVWSRHAMRMAGVMLRPLLRVSGRRPMALVMGHVVRRVRRIGRVGGTRRGDVWIYRYIGIRLDVLGMMMVILVSILQGH